MEFLCTFISRERREEGENLFHSDEVLDWNSTGQ